MSIKKKSLLKFVKKQSFKNNIPEFSRYTKLKIGILSSADILQESYGRVTTFDPFNYKTMRPKEGGLYCEKIFGPFNQHECICGKFSGKIYENMVCSDCGSEVLNNYQKRQRSGHIILEEPVMHYWFLHFNNTLEKILDLKKSELIKIIYFEVYFNKDWDVFSSIKIISTLEFDELPLEEQENYVSGAGGLLIVLERLNLEKLLIYLNANHPNNFKRIKAVQDFLKSGNSLSDFIVKVVRVMPAALRPVSMLESGFYGTVDINALYHLILIRNKTVNMFNNLYLASPKITRFSKTLLQRAFDCYIANENCSKPLDVHGRILKSLTGSIRGKCGLLRLNMLGKRTDFSARSVIVVNPNLRTDECGIPIKMALELFKPFLMQKLLSLGKASSMTDAINKIDVASLGAIEVLKQIVDSRLVLLNRAPTLHKNSFLSFKIKLVSGLTIEIPTTVCEGFNADFDGDQMGVYLTILPASTIEASLLSYSSFNIVSPATGRFLMKPSKEFLMTIYYMSSLSSQSGDLRIFYNRRDLEDALELNQLNLRDPIYFFDNSKLYLTNAGRVFLNNLLDESERNYEVIWNSNFINGIMQNIYLKYGHESAVLFLDNIQMLSKKWMAYAAISMSINDIFVPVNKDELVNTGFKLIDNLNLLLDKKLITNDELHFFTAVIWYSLINVMTLDMSKNASVENDVWLAVLSGARGNQVQLRQLGISRGILANTKGDILPTPILNSYKTGLSSIESFISSEAARKGTVDRSVNTRSGGYFTRNLVDAVHNIIISEIDCGTKDGFLYSENKNIDFYLRIKGRCLAQDIPELELYRNTVITEQVLEILRSNNIKPKIRSIFTCKSNSICSMCYGIDLSSNMLANVGLAAGVIASQSLGEPILQLTMRTFHTGGVVDDNNLDRLIFGSGCLSFDLNKVIVLDLQNIFKYQVIEKVLVKVGEKEIILSPGSLIAGCNGDILNEQAFAILAESDIYLASDNGNVNFIDRDKNIDCIIGESTVSINKSSNFLVSNNDYLTKDSIIAKFHYFSLKNIDILSDLSALKRILDIYKPKVKAILSPISGTLEIYEKSNKISLYVVDENNTRFVAGKVINKNLICLNNGDSVEKGDILSKGEIYFGELLNFYSSEYAKEFILNKIKIIYLRSRLSISDQHFEILTNALFLFAKNKNDNYKLLKDLSEDEKSSYIPTIVGISRIAALNSSFLSSASFQGTSKILANSAVKGDSDFLLGLKENLIINNLLPTGTGFLNAALFKKDLSKSELNDIIKSRNLDLVFKHFNVFVLIRMMNDSLVNIIKKNADYCFKPFWYRDLIWITLESIKID